MSTPISLDTQIELGAMFGNVHASLIEDSVGNCVIGAHVEIDGNVIADTGLRPIDKDATTHEKQRQVRGMAVSAIIKAHKEIALEVTEQVTRDAFMVCARALPLRNGFRVIK